MHGGRNILRPSLFSGGRSIRALEILRGDVRPRRGIAGDEKTVSGSGGVTLLIAVEALMLALSLYQVFAPRRRWAIYRDSRIGGGFGLGLSIALLVVTIHVLNVGRATARTLASVIDLYPGSSYTTVPSIAGANAVGAASAAHAGDSASARRYLEASRKAALHPRVVLIADVHDSVSVVVRFFRAAAERRGWSPQADQTVESPEFVNLVYVRGEQQLTISVSEEWTSTQIFYTLERAPPPR